ncbi:hypothetical protein LIER_33393 [Lithospermum erythrorhizon]|uniref:Retrotransposon gag domain-containing protein n=1 Tax=Lithospermum erythrorhizon TaxID=34254 RepID=A0AAV3RZT1_LITER
MPPRVRERGRARDARGRPRGGRAGRGIAIDEYSVDQQGPEVQSSEHVEEVGVDLVEESGNAQVAEQQGVEFQSKLFDRFLRRDPPKFSGGSTEQAIEFIRDMKTIFEPMGIVGEMRVKFATYRLHEGARSWWENLSTSLTAGGEVPVSWEQFVELFRENYCLEAHMAALEK